jgi:nitronate monooxygenase
MPLSTRLTEYFGVKHPIISAPMALASGGVLAAAVSRAGGLGLIGGGYGDVHWLNEQFEAAGNQSVGCGFITWSLRKNPSLLDDVLSRRPKCLFLSFDDPEPFASLSHAQGIPVICQIQTVKDAARAIEVGAEVIVAQGSEAGGHGEKRSTFTLVPEVADLIAAKSADTILCAAGGVADGRGIAAALMLGADGVVVGSRFWASAEALVHPRMHQAAIAADGDDTVRSRVMDIVRAIEWPERFTARVLRNSFIDKWHGNEANLHTHIADEARRWRQAWTDGDVTVANTFVGEAVGLIHTIQPVQEIIEQLTNEAERIIRDHAKGI